MYRCWNCGTKFEEPDKVERFAEDYFGVGSMFDSKSTITIQECPNCGSDDIEEYYEDE